MERRMDLEPVIITHATLFNALGEYEAANEEIDRAVQGADASEAEILAQLDHIRFQLEQEGGPGDVMVAPRDQVASLYQSLMSERASDEPGKLAALQAGGYEAQ